MINDKGINPKKKKIIPLVFILLVKPTNIFNNKFPTLREAL